MDTPHDSSAARRLYEAAIQRDPEEWPEYLDVACAGRPELRLQVEALLEVRTSTLRELPGGAAPPAVESPDFHRSSEGKVIGPYIVRRELGRGGMGVVYLADDTRLSRRVALKTINIASGRDPSGKQRLRLEARAAARLSHPGIATVYALEEIDDTLYLACEYVPGEPLRALLRSGPLPIEQVVDVATQLAHALVAAHSEGIVHRDIKPENVMRTPSGIIKVLDFGLARIGDAAQSANLTQTGALLGTPAYLSPEQALGKQADFRADIFALGLVVYELATGRNPFAADTVAATVARIVEAEPEPLDGINPELNDIVSRCLRKDPGSRYQSTQELVADLERLKADLRDMRRHSPSDSSGQVYRSAHQARPKWWWEVHQLAVSATYVVMVLPAWYVQRSLTRPVAMVFLLSALSSVAAAASFRLHLWFVARHFPKELRAQLARSRRRVLICDVAFNALLLVLALATVVSHPEFAMLFVAVAVALLVAAFVIEPVTTRVAFGDPSDSQE